MGKGDGSNISVVWDYVKIYLAVAMLAVLHYFTKTYEFRTELSKARVEDNLTLQILLLFETIEFYWSVILILTILVGFNIARDPLREKPLVKSFSVGFFGALSYQIIMLILTILLVLNMTAHEVTDADDTSEGVEDDDFSIIEFLSRPIFHGILAITIAMPFQRMAPITRERKSIRQLIRQSNHHSDAIKANTKKIFEIIESQDENISKITGLELSDAIDRIDGEEETTELELSDAFDRLDGED